MRIRRGNRTNRKRRSVKASGREFEHRLNLLPRHMKLFDNFFNVRTRFKIFKHSETGFSVQVPDLATTTWHSDIDRPNCDLARPLDGRGDRC